MLEIEKIKHMLKCNIGEEVMSFKGEVIGLAMGGYVMGCLGEERR